MRMPEHTFEIAADVADEAHAIETITELAAKYRPPGGSAVVAIEDGDSGQVVSISRPVPALLADEAAHVLGTKLDKAQWSDEPRLATITVPDYKPGALRLTEELTDTMPERKRLKANVATKGEGVQIVCTGGMSIDSVQGYLDRNGIRYSIRYAKPKT